MTNSRRPEIPFSDAPRGTCRWCGEEILYADGAKRGSVDRRRRWHPACVKAYNATDPRELRRAARRRDRGVCAACDLDTVALRRKIRGKGRAARLRELGFTPRRSLWELDHTVPLVDGGTHDVSNLQTLCVPCHREKTGQEARLRAARARPGALPDEPREPARPEGGSDADWAGLLARAERVNARAEAVLADARQAKD